MIRKILLMCLLLSVFSFQNIYSQVDNQIFKDFLTKEVDVFIKFK